MIKSIKSVKKVLLVLSVIIAVGLSSYIVLGQNAPQRPQQQPKCEEMQKIFKKMQDHRTACEVCKTNMPFGGGRGMGGQGGPGGGRGQGGPRQ